MRSTRLLRFVAGRAIALWTMIAAMGAPVAPANDDTAQGNPDVLLITIDTLRADRMSGYGYTRNTSPNLDELMADGVRFTQARTVVPLTCPGLASMVTTMHPHEHGSTRNGLRIRQGLPSFPKAMRAKGYATAAVVSNWTLKDDICGLAEHFETWKEVLRRKRWMFGKKEATADDVTDEALSWLESHVAAADDRPFLLWVHYVEPHSPYVLHGEFLRQLELSRFRSTFSSGRRYDTEVAFVDDRIGRLLGAAEDLVDMDDTLVVFTADHGESLGDHGYWGHGRHVYEASLRIPFSITWPGRVAPGVIGAPALITDVGPTIMGLVRFSVPDVFDGFDWTDVLGEGAPEPMMRVTFHQAHRGTVKPEEDQVRLRLEGLLEVGVVDGMRKEVLVVNKDRRRVFDLTADHDELRSLVRENSAPSGRLVEWLDLVREGLRTSDSLPPPSLDEETMERLRALGYLD